MHEVCITPGYLTHGQKGNAVRNLQEKSVDTKRKSFKQVLTSVIGPRGSDSPTIDQTNIIKLTNNIIYGL